MVSKVSEYLIGQNPSGLQDLGQLLVVVPTRQAGRRLREALAAHAESNGGAVINPRVVTPNYFMMTKSAHQAVANPMLVDALWADLLQQSKESDLRALFPQGTIDHSFSWGLSFAAMIQDLRDTLLDGAYQINDMCECEQIELMEPERWHQLAQLERAYLTRLEQLGLQDPVSTKIASAQDPEIEAEIERIVLACVPDPTPILVYAMKQLAGQNNIEVLIHAPKKYSETFDDWGRPLSMPWTSAELEIPDADENLVLAATPAQQARQVIRLLADSSNRFGPADIAIGVPDQTIVPFLNDVLNEQGLLPFDPAGLSVVDEPLFDLLQRYANFIADPSYCAFSELLRHPQLLAHLHAEYALPTTSLLTELDLFQNEVLPLDFRDISNRVDDKSSLAVAVQVIGDFRNRFEEASLDSSLRDFLQAVYACRTVRSNRPQDEPFISAAKIVDALLRRFREEVVPYVRLSQQDSLKLFLLHLARERFYPEREGALVDLEGWLELPWNNASLLIVTGMNEGHVPDGRMSDVFLPDSLRQQLHIRSDTDRLARDIYLLQTLIHSRSPYGRLCLVAGKTSTLGDPLKPSRLLFRCADSELVARVKRFFAEVEVERTNCPSTISFKLNPVLNDPRLNQRLSSIRVTMFRDYLACPFRFYLSHGLNMGPLSDDKIELDAMDFGNLVHGALERLAQHPSLAHASDVEAISGFLQDVVRQQVLQQYGDHPSLAVLFQLQGLQQRLGAAARVQAQLVTAGWELIASEQKIESEINGMPVIGKIDRIDQHRETGVIRLLDYKTSDRSTPPQNNHLAACQDDTPDDARLMMGKKEQRWTDLQLPLYQLLYEAHAEHSAAIELGYFVLPKAVGETGVRLWRDWTPELLTSALRCAEGIIANVKARHFWPPSGKVKYDDFAAILPGSPEDCIDIDAFQRYMDAES